MATMTLKMGIALSVGIAYSVFLPLIGYEAGAENTEAAKQGLRFVYIVVPMACAAAMAAIMWTFPLDEEKQKEIHAALQAKEAEAGN